MVQTIVDGVVYDYYEPDITTGGGGEHTHTETDLTALEGRVTQNETVLGNATPNNTTDTLVKRASTVYLEDVVSRNLDAAQVIEVTEDNGYFYWENPNRNQFIQIGSSIQAQDPDLQESGFTHYHQNTATVEITGNTAAAPLRISANVDTIINMFEIVDTGGTISFAITRTGLIESQEIIQLQNTVSDLVNRVHILENNAGII